MPAIGVPYYQHDFHLEDSRLVCPLCDWENTPLTADGAEDPTALPSQERNDGISIAEARINFARYLSMYDPAKLEPWMLGPPSAEVLALKHALRDAYTALLSAPKRKQWEPLNLVKDRESALATQVDAERDNAQEI